MAALSAPAAIGLVAVSAGALGYALFAPLFSGTRRADKRRAALVGEHAARDAQRAQVSRRDQIANSLKELEAKEGSKRPTLERRLAHAGLTWTKQRFYVVSVALGLAFTFLGLVVTGSLWMAPVFGFTGALGAPFWLLIFLKKRRIAKFVKELPNAIDVVVRGIRAGLPVADCLRIIAREAQEPVRTEFRTIVEAQAVGMSLGDACAKLYERVPIAEANFFAIVIGIQQKSGGNLSEALGNLSRVLRERRKMVDKIGAMSMEAKASAAIIGAMPFIVGILTYLSSPQYIELLWTTQAGTIGLMAGGTWMTMGILVMRKMIRFDI